MARFLFFLLASCAFAIEAPLILYRFEDSEADGISDSSGIEPAAPLEISNPASVKRERGSLTILQPTLLATRQPPAKLIEAVRQSGEITLSAWVTPSNLTQKGPARIVTLSRDSSNRNVTLGQNEATFDARFRTARTGSNGIPSLSAGQAARAKTHLVFTRARDGQGRLFVNGHLAGTRDFSGSLQNWDSGFRLALGNELSTDRPWLGTFHEVAFYSRSISQQEVEELFQGKAQASNPAQPVERSRELFVNHIEGLLARHCLECHDATTAEGDLDLSQKMTAFRDPDLIIPGSPEKSILWEVVASDEMPEKRSPLSAREKSLLREWLETGAVWSRDHLDPAAHLLLTDPGKFPRRLTISEYLATVEALTGISIEKEARELLPPDLRTDGFRNTAYNLGVDLKHVEAYARLANLIVSKINIAKFAARFSRNRSTTQRPIRAHLQALGTEVFRGPLSDREIDLYQGIVTSVGSAGGGFDEAFAWVLRAMLQSPRFLYRLEGEGPPTSYELASRLSYLIWGGPPDRALLEAAQKNALHQPAALRREVERMLRDPRAVAQSLTFISEWLDLDHLDHLQPDPEKFPGWHSGLATDMRRETLAFARHLLWEEKRPLGDLLNARLTFLTPRLAEHYGLEPQDAEFAKYDLSQSPRGGLLTQGSLLTIGGDEASMVARGLFVLHDLLRGAVKDPPPGVDTTPVASAPGLSQRTVAEQRLEDQSCAGCHVKFEPLAFGLERYDGLARYSRQDHFGNDLREDGEIRIPGSAAPVKYETSRELMDLLAKSPRVQQNLIWKLAQFALGRPVATSDRPHLDALYESVGDEQTYQNVILHLATSPLITR